MSNEMTCYKIGDPFPSLKPCHMRLYAMRYCPYSHRIWLILEYKKIPYDIIFVWLRDKCPQWIKDRNPNGAVPVLEMDRQIIYESLVCAQYLDDAFPRRKLTPSDPYEKACQSMLIAAWDKVTSAYHAIVDKIDDREKWDSLLTALDRFEKAYPTGSTFFGGDLPCLVDFSIYPWFERFPALSLLAPSFSIPKTRFPQLCTWQRTMRRLSCVRACSADPASHAAVIKSFPTGQPDYGYGMASAHNMVSAQGMVSAQQKAIVPDCC